MMTMQEAAKCLDDTLGILDHKEMGHAFVKEYRLQLEKSLIEGNQEIQNTLAYLTEFGAITRPIQNLRKWIAEAKTKQLSYDASEKKLQKLVNISDQELMEIYQVCYTLFQEKQFEKAASVATLLGCLNQEVSSFWRMLGLCYQNMGNEGAALMPFLYASMVNSLDGKNHACALGSLLKLGFAQEASRYYETAKEILSDLHQEEDIRVLDLIMKQK